MTMRRLSVLTSIFLGGAALVGSVERGLADKRVALVIGNYSYQNVEQLLNPKNDAPAIAKMFKDMGFDQVDLVTDVGNVEFKRAIRHFADASADADVAVVYYAGHAIEVGGVNYILPVDAKVASDRDVEDEAIDLDRIVDSDGAKKLRLVIVDACRDNPFLAAKQQHQAVRSTAPVLSARKPGLGRVNVAGSQTLVAYAAEAGTSAEDGVGHDAHSPFTAALLRHLPEPGEDIRFAFGRIRDDVLKATDKRQLPFVYGSLGGDHISLVPGQLALNDVKGDYDRADKVGTRRAFEIFLAQYPTGYYADLAREALGKLPPPAPPAPDDARAWEKIKDTTDQAALRNFIKRFPDSPLATNAEHRLQVLADGEVTRAWERVDKANAAAIHNFMKAFPASALAASTGKARLNELDQQAKEREAKKQAEIAAAKKLEAEREAAQAWQKVKKAGDRNAVLDFINHRYPDSPLLAEAQQRLVAIDQEERERKAKQEAEAAEAKKRQLEREAAQEWEKVKLSTDPSALLAFLSRYPNAAVSDQARQRVADLDREARERLERQQKEAEAAQREWDGIKSTDDRAALKAFIGRHPTSPLATGEAKQRLGVLDREAKEREQQAVAAEAQKRQVEREAAQEWEKIRSSTDQTALLTFLSRYRDAAVSDQARQRLADLDRQAQETWEKIKDSADRGVIRGFINQYPASLVALIDANERLLAMEREAHKNQAETAAAQAEWNAVNKNDVAAISDIVARFPDAPFAGDAKKRISELQREEKVQAEKVAAARDWYELKNSRDAAAIRAFIRKYPTTSLALNEAKERLDALTRESDPRPSSAGHSADAGHQQVAPKPAEPAHRREPSPGARNFSGIGF
jgi:outer membrane protein assembly factor BamD (BamD/ComL family)